MKPLLFSVLPRPPHPSRDGLAIRNFHLLAALTEHFRVRAFSLLDPERAYGRGEVPPEIEIDWIAQAPRRPRRVWAAAASLSGGRAYSELLYRSARARASASRPPRPWRSRPGSWRTRTTSGRRRSRREARPGSISTTSTPRSGSARARRRTAARRRGSRASRRRASGASRRIWRPAPRASRASPAAMPRPCARSGRAPSRWSSPTASTSSATGCARRRPRTRPSSSSATCPGRPTPTPCAGCTRRSGPS